tara:strand:- start:2056 stop:3546 length:1491 start_codon:yes stop_codon:yes gene_type:complete
MAEKIEFSKTVVLSSKSSKISATEKGNKERTPTVKKEDRAFNEIIKSKNKVDIKEFFRIHEEVFYKIPKKGKKSHTSLINDSQNFINNHQDPKDAIIDKLTDEIDQLSTDLNKLEQPTGDDENPFYPNKTLIRTSVRNVDGLPIWIMVNGIKREFKNYDIYLTAKKAMGHDISTPDSNILQEADEATLESIPSGTDINTETDLVMIDDDTSFQYEDINLGTIAERRYARKITCKEKETFDDKGKCYVKYYDMLGRQHDIEFPYNHRIHEDYGTNEASQWDVASSFDWQPDPNSTNEAGFIESTGYMELQMRVPHTKTIVLNFPTDIELGGPPKYSNYGPRMFTPPPPKNDGYTWDGASSNALDVWDKVLSDKDNPYYNTSKNYYYEGNFWLSGGPVGDGSDVYGAPILRKGNNYIAMLKVQDWGTTTITGTEGRMYYVWLSGNKKGELGSMFYDDSKSDYKNPKYDGFLAFDPARVNSDFNGIGWCFNRNGDNDWF